MLLALVLACAPAFAAQLENAPVRAPMTPVQLSAVQAFLNTPTGDTLMRLQPTLAAIPDMKASAPSHLAALGGLAANLDGPVTAGSLLTASQDPAHAAQVKRVLSARVDELKSADGLSDREKKRAARELGPLADLADGFSSKSMAKAAEKARKLADVLEPPHAGMIKWIDVLDLRPMQFDVGMQQVEKKKAAMLKMTPAQRRAYLLKHPVPVVVRRNGDHHVHKGGAQSERNRRENRPDDHHHEARAAWEAGVTRIPVIVEKVEDPQKKTKKFWKSMRRDNKVWLKDRWGRSHDEEDLPMDVRGLGDNPYRSIAGEVRDRGGYKKNHAPFSEFLWAEYFRENLTLHPNDDFEGAVREAMKLARDKRARKLPGYLGK